MASPFALSVCVHTIHPDPRRDRGLRAQWNADSDERSDLEGRADRKRKDLFVAGRHLARIMHLRIRAACNTIPLKRAQHVALVQASVPQEMKDALDEDTYDPDGSTFASI